MLVVGDAEGFCTVEELNPVAGTQENVVAVVVVLMVTLLFAQMVRSGPAFTVGNGFTVMETIAVFVHPLALLPVTV